MWFVVIVDTWRACLPADGETGMKVSSNVSSGVLLALSSTRRSPVTCHSSNSSGIAAFVVEPFAIFQLQIYHFGCFPVTQHTTKMQAQGPGRGCISHPGGTRWNGSPGGPRRVQQLLLTHLQPPILNRCVLLRAVCFSGCWLVHNIAAKCHAAAPHGAAAGYGSRHQRTAQSVPAPAPGCRRTAREDSRAGVYGCRHAFPGVSAWLVSFVNASSGVLNRVIPLYCIYIHSYIYRSLCRLSCYKYCFSSLILASFCMFSCISFLILASFPLSSYIPSVFLASFSLLSTKCSLPHLCGAPFRDKQACLTAHFPSCLPACPVLNKRLDGMRWPIHHSLHTPPYAFLTFRRPALHHPCPPPSLSFPLNDLGPFCGLRLFQLQLQQQQAEGASRQDAARLGAMNSKLTKDFNRVNAIALDLGAQVCVRVRGIAWVGGEIFVCVVCLRFGKWMKFACGAVRRGAYPGLFS